MLCSGFYICQFNLSLQDWENVFVIFAFCNLHTTFVCYLLLRIYCCVFYFCQLSNSFLCIEMHRLHITQDINWSKPLLRRFELYFWFLLREVSLLLALVRICLACMSDCPCFRYIPGWVVAGRDQLELSESWNPRAQDLKCIRSNSIKDIVYRYVTQCYLKHL